MSDAKLPSVARRAVVAQHVEAIARISTTFGRPRAHPMIVHLSRPDALWPLTFNSFGSTSFLPGRTCIVLGPDGRNVDVLAHELVHAEIADRVGWWRRRTQVPTWFDEGAGMQVDYRSTFNLPKTQRVAGASVIQSRDTSGEFFDVPSKQLVQHYAQAKSHVAVWLDRVGPENFYDRLAKLRSGKRFQLVWDE